MYARDNGECYACHTTRGLTEQHRLNRKQGGRSGEGLVVINRPANRLTLCWSCNGRCESDAEFARVARAMGWKLEEHEDPTRVAAYHTGFREWRRLDDDGSYEVVDGRDPVEMPLWAVA